MDLNVPVEKVLLTKVLQTLWFNEGGSAAHSAITEGAGFARATRLTGSQAQFLPERENKG